MASPPVKIVGVLQSTTEPRVDVSNDAGRFFAKLLYEFWGFVVNGGNSTTVAGGYPAGALSYPSGFESGSSLLADGIDGLTRFPEKTFFSDSTDFVALNAQGALKDKYLVMWKSGSTSYDDGIYKILGTDSTTGGLEVDITYGGTPRLGNKPTFRDRTNINFRIVDIESVVDLAGWADGQSQVIQFEGASDVNPGQATSQAQIIHRDLGRDVGIVVSPSGSWNGSTFTDGSSEVLRDWFNPGGDGMGLFYLAGGKDFLIVHVHGLDGTWNANPAGCHIEIPQRLYPREFDPNPICFMNWENDTPDQTTTTATQNTYATGFNMIGHDGVTREWSTLVRSPHGDRVNTNLSPTNDGIWENFNDNSRFFPMNYNVHTNLIMTSDALLHLNVSGQFSLARCRLRRVRFTSDNRDRGFRGGTNWVFTAWGVLWPWNNTVIPFGPLWEGA